MKTIIIENGTERLEAGAPVVKRKTLHNIFLLDASGSMNLGSYDGTKYRTKYNNAIDGINTEIKGLKNSEVDVLVSFYEFDSNTPGQERITQHCVAKPVADCPSYIGRGARGNTPLYQSLAYVIETFLRTASNDDQVLISIYTDGAHNCYWGKYGSEAECKKLIKDVEKNRGFVITFVGMERDVQNVVNNLGISIGNTYTYDGSAKGLKDVFETSTKYRTAYVSNLAATGQGTTVDFFNSNTTDNTETTVTDGDNKIQETNNNSTTTN